MFSSDCTNTAPSLQDLLIQMKEQKDDIEYLKGRIWNLEKVVEANTKTGTVKKEEEVKEKRVWLTTDQVVALQTKLESMKKTNAEMAKLIGEISEDSIRVFRKSGTAGKKVAEVLKKWGGFD